MDQSLITISMWCAYMFQWMIRIICLCGMVLWTTHYSTIAFWIRLEQLQQPLDAFFSKKVKLLDYLSPSPSMQADNLPTVCTYYLHHPIYVHIHSGFHIL